MTSNRLTPPCVSTSAAIPGAVHRRTPIYSLILLALLAWPASADPSNPYGFCKVVTTSHSMVSGATDLTNYPLTVTLTDADLKNTANGGMVNNSNGYDIGFFSDCSAAATPLKWEVDSYNSATGAIVAHVLRPTLSATIDDTIGMWYGGAFTTLQSSAPAVWNSNYRVVYHFPNGVALASPTLDSTSNASNATINGATATSGKIDGGVSFSGSGASYLTLAANGKGKFDLQNMTVSSWVQTPASWGPDGDARILFSYDFTSHASPYYAHHLRFSSVNGTPGVIYWGWNDGTNFQGIFSAAPVSANAWHQIVAVYTSGRQEIWVDGVIVASSARTDTIAFYNQPAWVDRANFMNPGKAFAEDELRVSNIALPAGWIVTEYRNQSAPATYITSGPRQTFGTSRHRVTNGI